MSQTTSATPGAGHYTSPAPEIGIRDRYISRSFAELEAERLWPRVWQLACNVAQVPEVGDFYEYRIADQSILVVRSGPDEVRAFHNTCLHRGMRLKEGSGNATEIRCPSHAWCWNLDGSLKEVTDAFDFDAECVSAQRLGLRECRAETWAGFVFVNMDRDAQPLQEFLAPVPERVEHFGFDRMVCTRHRSALLEANWKLAHEAFVETYHAVGTHPQSLRYLDDTGMTYEQHGDHGMHRVKLGAMGVPSPRLGEFAPDRREILLAMVGDMAEADYYKDEERAQVDALIETAVGSADVPLGTFFANVRREQAKAEGLDFSPYADHDVLVGELWNVFPNFTTPCNAGNGSVIRFRPHGLDPEVCTLDIFYLQRVPEGAERPKPEEEHVGAWHETSWGAVLEQDFTNIPIWQKGLHSRGFTGPIWGRQDGNVANFHRALSGYLGV